jgi:hypothetical protein
MGPGDDFMNLGMKKYGLMAIGQKYEPGQRIDQWQIIYEITEEGFRRLVQVGEIYGTGVHYYFVRKI